MNKIAIPTHVSFRPRNAMFSFPFVSMFRQTDDIGKKRPKTFVEQGIIKIIIILKNV